MNIFLGAFGSRGDVVPRVCLGAELAARGHTVTVGCVREYRSLVELNRLTWMELGKYPAKEDEDRTLSRIMQSPSPALRGEMLLTESFFPMLPGLALQLAKIYDSFDAVSVNDLLIPAILDTNYGAVERFFITLTAQPVGGFASSVIGARCTKLVGSSRTLLAANIVLPEQFAITDFWLPEPTARYEAPALEAFLSSSQPAVAIAFASAWGRDPYFSESTLVDAVRMAGVRAVIQDTRPERSRGLISNTNPPIFVVGEVPYSWLFARVSCVIHHGGAGTISETLRAGRPAISLPQYGDQQYWAQRLEAIGASAGTLLPDEVEPSALSKLIRRAIEDKAVRLSAAEIGRTIDSRRGISDACKLIEALPSL